MSEKEIEIRKKWAEFKKEEAEGWGVFYVHIGPEDIDELLAIIDRERKDRAVISGNKSLHENEIE